MAKLAKAGKTNPAIVYLSRNIVRNVPGKDYLGEVKAVQEWVKNNIRYTRDIYCVETLHDVDAILRLGQGDCDDHAILVASLLLSLGHPVKFKAVAVNGRPNHCHVFVITRVGKKWLSVETTEPWEVGHEPPNFFGAVPLLHSVK